VHDDECHFTTARIFMPGPNTDPAFQDTVTPVVKAFLATISDYAAEYLAEVARPNPGRKPNYEDLYSLAEQAMRVESDYVPNLAAVEFYARLRRDTAPLHCGFKGGSDGGVGFVGLTATACDFLHWAVYRALHPEGAERRGLQFISETASNVAALDVFTLNHDLLVETQLKSDGHPNVESGFDDRSQGEAGAPKRADLQATRFARLLALPVFGRGTAIRDPRRGALSFQGSKRSACATG
jgi:hypothetical protein